MKRSLILLFLACSVQNVHALKAATQEEYAKIEVLLLKKATREIDMASNRARQSADKAEDRWRYDREYARYAEERKTASEQALWLTIKAYDLMPFVNDQPVLQTGVSSLRSPQLGKPVTWVPIFEDDVPHNYQNARGGITTRNVPLGSDVAGNTSSDGVSRLLPGAFSTPALLALTIYHERVHFEQMTGPRHGGGLTPGESEVAAYKAEERIALSGIFRLTADEMKTEKAYVAKNLKKRERQAAAERAAVTKAGGLPIDEFSIASLPAGEINRLIATARSQVSIAQRDHDERLKVILADLARQSCERPGSIGQAMLDRIPVPYDSAFVYAPPQDRTQHCRNRVYSSLTPGANANDIDELSRPLAPLVPEASKPPIAPVEAIAEKTFGHILPDLKFYAELACQYRGHIPMPVVNNPFVPRVPYTLRAGDDNAAVSLAASLGNCEGHVVRRLYNELRNGRGGQIDTQWFVNAVANTPTAPPPPPPTQGGGFVSPPQNRDPGTGDPCRDNGNLRCPPITDR